MKIDYNEFCCNKNILFIMCYVGFIYFLLCGKKNVTIEMQFVVASAILTKCLDNVLYYLR